MATILLDSDYSDELLHINEEPLFEYGSTFAMDDLYTNETKLNNNTKENKNSLYDSSCRVSDCSSEEEELSQPNAPPPSPQDTSMLDMLFASKLTSSLEACLVNNKDKDTADNNRRRNSIEQVQTLDKLLQKSTNKRGIQKKKSHKRSCSLQSNSTHWQTRANNQKILNIVKVTEQAEKLRKALQKHLIDEETSVMINELKDMGL